MSASIQSLFSGFKQADSGFVDGYSVEEAFCLSLLIELLEYGKKAGVWDIDSDAFLPENTLGYYKTVSIQGIPFEMTVCVPINGAINGSEEEKHIIYCECLLYPEGSSTSTTQVMLSAEEEWHPREIVTALVSPVYNYVTR